MEPFVILTGTDPATAKGGIGAVMNGYQDALNKMGIAHECILTYVPGSLLGKWYPWLKALPRLVGRVRSLKAQGKCPVMYCHAGAGLSLFRECLVMLLAHWMGARTILQVHAPEVDRYLNNRLQKWLLTLAFRPADRVCLLTRWWREKMWDAGIRSELRVVHNPLPSVLEQTAKCDVTPKSQNASVTVLSMARLVPGKGVDVVIRAMAMLPHHVRLVVAGDGKERKALESLARELGVENRVSFVGWAEGETKTRLLQEADIFCLPSTYDAFPMSMVEAMAFGVPVVAVRWGGIPDMVADGRAGLLANRPEPDLVAAAIRELSDAEVRYRMAARAKQWILEISSAGVVGDNLSQLIQEVAECK